MYQVPQAVLPLFDVNTWGEGPGHRPTGLQAGHWVPKLV